MKKCICQICICGSHRCRNRLLKDLLGQNPTNAKLPASETKGSFRGYTNAPPAEIIRPMGGDWNYEYTEYSPPFRVQPFKSETRREDNYPRKDVLDESNDQKGREREQETEAINVYPLDSKEKIVVPKKRVPSPEMKELILPPLAKDTMYSCSYSEPPPISQLPNHMLKIRKGYDRPTQPMQDNTLYMRDFKPWDLKCGLQAPNPKTGKFELRIPEDNLKSYKVPMEYLTTCREGYGFPPIDVNRIQLCLQPGCDDLEKETLFQCDHHKSPQEKFVNRSIYRTSYRDQYGPPCVHRDGWCQHGRKESEFSKTKHCPASGLLEGVSHENYDFVESCCGHDIFKEKIPVQNSR